VAVPKGLKIPIHATRLGQLRFISASLPGFGELEFEVGNVWSFGRAQRFGHVQPTIVDDARGTKEQVLQIKQLGVSPIEILKGCVRALDEVG
jgi:hypothetical protein